MSDPIVTIETSKMTLAMEDGYIKPVVVCSGRRAEPVAVEFAVVVLVAAEPLLVVLGAAELVVRFLPAVKLSPHEL